MRNKFSLYFRCILISILCCACFSGAVLLAQSPDENYERRAQEVVAGLTRLNGLMGWEPFAPSTWPPASFDLDENSPGPGLQGDPGAGFSQDSPARLTGLRLANLGLSRAADFSGLSALLSLEVPGNDLRALNLADTLALRRITAMKNQLGRLDLSRLSELRWLALSSNQLENLELRGSPELRELSVSMNRLSQLDVSGNPRLAVLEAMNNRLAALALEGNPLLTRLAVSYNSLEELSVGRNPALVELGARDNRLSRLDLSANPELRTLALSRNRLSHLDLSRNPRLESLAVDQNRLHILDLSANPQLEVLQAGGNPLVELRLGQNPLPRLRLLNLDGCRLPLSRLYPLSGLAKDRGRLGTQENVLFEEISLEYANGQATLDLSAEALIGGEATEFWALNDKKRRLRPSEYRAEGGYITFFKPGRYMVLMSNPKVFSSDVNQLTGRIHAIKAKAYTGLINVAGQP